MKYCKKCSTDTERYGDGKCKPCRQARNAKNNAKRTPSKRANEYQRGAGKNTFKAFLLDAVRRGNGLHTLPDEAEDWLDMYDWNRQYKTANGAGRGYKRDAWHRSHLVPVAPKRIAADKWMIGKTTPDNLIMLPADVNRKTGDKLPKNYGKQQFAVVDEREYTLELMHTRQMTDSELVDYIKERRGVDLNNPKKLENQLMNDIYSMTAEELEQSLREDWENEDREWFKSWGDDRQEWDAYLADMMEEYALGTDGRYTYIPDTDQAPKPKKAKSNVEYYAAPLSAYAQAHQLLKMAKTGLKEADRETHEALDYIEQMRGRPDWEQSVFRFIAEYGLAA